MKEETNINRIGVVEIEVTTNWGGIENQLK